MNFKTASSPFATRCPNPFAAVLLATPLLAAVLFAAALLATSPVQAEPLATTSENGSVVDFTKLVLDPEAKTWTGVTSDGETKTYSSETAIFETAAGILKCEWDGLSFFADKKERSKDRVNLGWEYDGWCLGGGDVTTPPGVVTFKKAKRKPVKVGLMVYMPDGNMWRFETAPPVEDRFFQNPEDCDVVAKAGIFLPSGKKMFLYWPADDTKRANSTPVVITRVGETFVLEHGALPDYARPASGKKAAGGAPAAASKEADSKDPVGEITEKKGGRKHACEAMTYGTTSNTWTCERPDGSTLYFSAKAASVRTPAGGIWFDKGLHIGPPRGPIIAVGLPRDMSWHISKSGDTNENLGKVTIRENRRTFKVGNSFFHDKDTGNWCIYAEESSGGSLLQDPKDVDIETGAGLFDMEGSDLVIRWKKDDPLRKNRRPMVIRSDGTEWRFFRTESAQ